MALRANASLLVDCRATLGEGVQWHRQTRRVYWTDIKGNALWSCGENGESERKVPLEEGLCDFAFTPDGKMLAAFADGLYWLEPRSGKRSLIEPYMPDNPGTRMNDGCLDRQGRFIIGGIDEAETAPITPVWSVSRGKVSPILTGVGIANSTAFSPDGGQMYFADSRGRDIFVFDYDTLSGTPSNRRVFATLTEAQGVPDGSTVDAEGALWNACFGGGIVQRFLPDGTPDMVIDLPVPNITCVAIGGMRMNRLFITTARIDMTDEELAASPEAGGLYVVDIPSKGLAPGFYRR